MHQPKYFQEKDTENILRLVQDNPLATLVLANNDNFEVNHIPFVVDSDNSGITTLRAHIPKANALTNLLTEPRSCVVIFQGADGYISPSWYATKQQHGKVVPTWNYAVVHVHGQIRMHDDSSWLMRQLEDLTRQNEEKRANSWQVSDAPKDYTERQLSALVGLEINATKIEAKTKASQNQPAENRTSVLQSLSAEQPDSNLTDMMHNVNKNRVKN